MTRFDLQESVERELLKTLRHDLHYAIAAAWVSGSLLLYGLWPVTDHARLTGWFAALSLILVVSMLILRRYGREGERHPPRYWLSLNRRMMILFTAVWVVGIFLFFPDHAPLYQAFFIITLAGVTAGGASTLSSDRISATILNVGVLTALVLRLLTEEGRIYRVEIWLVLLYMLMMLYIIERLYRGRRALMMEWHRDRENASRLAKSRKRLEFLFDAVPTGIFYYDRNLNIIESNALFSRLITGKKETPEPLPEGIKKILRQALKSPGGEVEEEIRLNRRGRTRWLRVKATAIEGEGRRDGVAIVVDITGQKKRMDRIRYQAEHDPLTRLPNRDFFIRTLALRLKHLDTAGESLGILFVDLDNFKPINDRFGHLLGDRVLRAAGRRLRHHFRRRDLVARYGGDEFVILIGKLPADETKARFFLFSIAETLIELFDHPLAIGGNEYAIGLSVGMALCGDSSADPQSLMERADRAMYRAKALGKHRAVYLSESAEVYLHHDQRLPAEGKPLPLPLTKQRKTTTPPEDADQ